MAPRKPEQISTGTPGLDYILRGGLPRGHSFLLRGGAGSGKTTLALQFLLEGVRQGEPVVFVALAQHEDDLREHAHSHGWSLEGIVIHTEARERLIEGLHTRQNVIHPSDVQLQEVIENVGEVFDTHQPERFVFDSIGVLRTLTGDLRARYHEEVVLLQDRARRAGTTALFIDDLPGVDDHASIRTLAYGAIEMRREMAAYGADRRRLHVCKMRGLDYQTGWHHFTIRTGELEVFPRLQPPEDAVSEHRLVKSGSEALDEMLGGGLHSGTACLVVGQAGTGKTTVASSYIYAGLQRGERAAVYLLDERPDTYLARSKNMGMDVGEYVERGLLQLHTIDMSELSPGQFAQDVRRAVDAGARIIALDSLTGYFHAAQEQHHLIAQLHELLAYTSRRGVLSIVLMAQHGLMGTELRSPIDISYIADTVLLLRNFESRGAVRRAVSVVKKRYGDHEKLIREMQITDQGVEVGRPIQAVGGDLSRPVGHAGAQAEPLDEETGPGDGTQ